MSAATWLLAARIKHAREAGCDIVVTETGELRDDRPSNSYRNILRAGVRGGLGDGELAATCADRYANPVTSHRRRKKRAPINTRRVTISTVRATHTPRTPEPVRDASASAPANATKATAIDNAR